MAWMFSFVWIDSISCINFKRPQFAVQSFQLLLNLKELTLIFDLGRNESLDTKLEALSVQEELETPTPAPESLFSVHNHTVKVLTTDVQWEFFPIWNVPASGGIAQRRGLLKMCEFMINNRKGEPAEKWCQRWEDNQKEKNSSEFEGFTGMQNNNCEIYFETCKIKWKIRRRLRLSAV